MEQQTNGNGKTNQKCSGVSGNELDAYRSQGTSPPRYEELQAEERLQRVLELLVEADLERLSEVLGDGRKTDSDSDSQDVGIPYNTTHPLDGGTQP